LKSIFHVRYPIMFTAFKCVICSIFLPQHISAFGKGCIVVDLRITYAITSISYVTHLHAIAHVARGLHFFSSEQSMWRICSSLLSDLISQGQTVSLMCICLSRCQPERSFRF
jgi:hypothetical protein